MHFKTLLIFLNFAFAIENDLLNIENLGKIFKQQIEAFKAWEKSDIVFLIDGSSSVGEENFKSELKFVKKLLSDVIVDYEHTRISIVTFSSTDNIVKIIDQITNPKREYNKCLLLNRQLNVIQYKGGGTYTLGAFKLAQEIFGNSRNDSKKILFLITDGFSNGGDPVPLAEKMKRERVTIFTIGIQNGNSKELSALSNDKEHNYLLESFGIFESLARHALHVDLKSGDYIPLGINSPCDGLCEENENCCDRKAYCTCGTSTGHYACTCEPGFYGTGLKDNCLPCPSGTYSTGPNLCLPCPDLHHTTTPSSIGVESCFCKIGYQSTEGHQCKILECPKISTPKHGYLVKKQPCGNVLNSACGVRCEVGYTLVGTSIRLCQSNATWSGEKPTCQIKTCIRLLPPDFGYMNCSHTDLGVKKYTEKDRHLPVDTVCTFSCEKGRILIGSKQRTCLPLSRWDGLKTSCKPIKCPKLSPIKNAKIAPKSCTTSKQVFGTKCTIKCEPGFDTVGEKIRICNGTHGKWYNAHTPTICKDITPPALTDCPENKTINTRLGKKYATTNWNSPNISDNSQLPVQLWMKPAILNIAEYQFQIGTTKISYYAQDVYQNRGECVFFVTVLDQERPIIEDCQNPITFLTNDRRGVENITWIEPHIFDNSQSLTVHKSHDFHAVFPIGTTAVTYTAIDSSGNRNECVLNITVEEAKCESLPDPIFGSSNCTRVQNTSINCIITCQDGYAVPLIEPQSSSLDVTSYTDEYKNNSIISFVCNQSSDSIWYNPDGLASPECSVVSVPNEVEKSGVVQIDTDLDNCGETLVLDELENDIRITLKEENCVGSCALKTNVICTDDEQEEEKTNKVRERRSNVPPILTPRKRRHRINVNFQIKAKYLGQHSHQKSHRHATNNTTIIVYHDSKYICPVGFIFRTKNCVQCPKGTFQNVTKNRCQACPFGTYSSEPGQIECKKCPKHHSTRKIHSKKATDCRKYCPPGTYGRIKIVRAHNRLLKHTTLQPYCRSCVLGHYQPDYGQTKCIPCPVGFTTSTARGTDIDQCVPTAEMLCTDSPCNGRGKCVPLNDLQYSCECFHPYFGLHCENRISVCDSNPCQNDGVCIENGTTTQCGCKKGFYGQFCEGVDEKCLLICLNGGTCLQNDDADYLCVCPDGFIGDTCEIRQFLCENETNLCENNGTCINDVSGGYQCLCRNGFIGKRCSLLPCDYGPCLGTAVCSNILVENATRDDYKCTCPGGFEGEKCDHKINYCKNMVCANGGTCVNDETHQKFSCVCAALFEGKFCEVKRNLNCVLKFEKYSIQNYVQLDGFRSNISNISTCLWMNTEDSFNYGTLLSYATKTFDNAFTLTDYSGLVLYVNNEYIVSDILLNDGRWHHLCITWEGSRGDFEIYVDGVRRKNGTNLAVKTSIEPNGNMIVGQEQDILGGKFSQSESFVGRIAYFDIWSRILTFTEILQNMNSCTELVFGDLFAWPEIYRQTIVGGVEIVNFTEFCMVCKDPSIVYNGFVNVVENVAYYECNFGYKLSGVDYSEGRKCLKTGQWEGEFEPYCKIIDCGYPGYVPNSETNYTEYTYQSEVQYKCAYGYSLNGNDTIKCTENGTWYPEPPKCVMIECKKFAKPDNSNITILTLVNDENLDDTISLYEDIAHFQVGFQLEIQCQDTIRLLTCQENGTWDFEVPKCEVIKPKSVCDFANVPRAPKNGFLYRNETSFVEYKCENGFQLKGENFSTCIIDGYWTELNMDCKKITCIKPRFKNMIILDQDKDEEIFVLGKLVNFNCVNGYRMFGNSHVQCLANGRWSRMKGKCLRKSCKKPNVSVSTLIEGNSYLYEDSVTITCPDGAMYTLKCNEQGIWEGNTC